jgi:hypothetical protein
VKPGVWINLNATNLDLKTLFRSILKVLLDLLHFRFAGTSSLRMTSHTYLFYISLSSFLISIIHFFRLLVSSQFHAYSKVWGSLKTFPQIREILIWSRRISLPCSKCSMILDTSGLKLLSNRFKMVVCLASHWVYSTIVSGWLFTSWKISIHHHYQLLNEKLIFNSLVLMI